MKVKVTKIVDVFYNFGFLTGTSPAGSSAACSIVHRRSDSCVATQKVQLKSRPKKHVRYDHQFEIAAIADPAASLREISIWLCNIGGIDVNGAKSIEGVKVKAKVSHMFTLIFVTISPRFCRFSKSFLGSTAIVPIC